MGKGSNRNKGPRRAYLKRFSSSMVNAGKQANKLVLGQYAKRAASLRNAPTEAEMTNYAKNEERFKERRVFELKPKDVVLDLCKSAFSEKFWHGHEKFYRIHLIKTPNRHLFLFFSGDKYFFVQESVVNPVSHDRLLQWQIRVSFVYGSREIAMDKYRRANIFWEDVVIVRGSHEERLGIGPKLELENFAK